MQSQAPSTWLCCCLTLLVHSGCIHLWIGPFILQTDGALQTVESYSIQKGSFLFTFWRRRDTQCKKSVKVHLKMCRIPQTSVLSVPLHRLPTVGTPAAGQDQWSWCQQLAAIPLWSQNDIKLWGLYKVSASDKRKGKISAHPCTPEIENELEFFYVLIFKKAIPKHECFKWLWRGERGIE